MTRRLALTGFAALALFAASAAGADELPIRKAGLWEMKVLRAGSPMPDISMQHCTDATTDKQMSTSFSPTKDTCSKQEIRKTATGYVSDSVCSFGSTTVTSRAEITGDFNSAYTVKSTSHSDRAIGTAPRDSTTTIEAKWLGACKADQKPGDIVMPGGMKMNILDLDKMKAMLPKAPAK